MSNQTSPEQPNSLRNEVVLLRWNKVNIGTENEHGAELFNFPDLLQPAPMAASTLEAAHHVAEAAVAAQPVIAETPLAAGASDLQSNNVVDLATYREQTIEAPLAADASLPTAIPDTEVSLRPVTPYHELSQAERTAISLQNVASAYTQEAA